MTIVPDLRPSTAEASPRMMDLAYAAEYAKTVGETEFVTASLRNNIPAITAALLYGAGLGMSAPESLLSIHIIDGRPSVSAEALRALIQKAGHEIWPVERSNTRVTVAGRRRGEEVEVRVTWTLDDARASGRRRSRARPRAAEVPARGGARRGGARADDHDGAAPEDANADAEARHGDGRAAARVRGARDRPADRLLEEPDPRRGIEDHRPARPQFPCPVRTSGRAV